MSGYSLCRLTFRATWSLQRLQGEHWVQWLRLLQTQICKLEQGRSCTRMRLLRSHLLGGRPCLLQKQRQRELGTPLCLAHDGHESAPGSFRIRAGAWAHTRNLAAGSRRWRAALPAFAVVC